MNINPLKLKSDRQYEFAKMYHKWVCDCLIKDELWEELALFTLGVDVCVRRKELLSITYPQIDFPIVKQIPILKKYKGQKTQHYYDNRIISEDTHSSIIAIGDNIHSNDKIFKYPMEHYIERIKKSIGDNHFNYSTIRYIGTIFVFNKVLSSIKE